MKDTSTERDITKRCSSAEAEREGRTHKCRLTVEHTGKHLCICSRSWEDFEAVRS